MPGPLDLLRLSSRRRSVTCTPFLLASLGLRSFSLLPSRPLWPAPGTSCCVGCVSNAEDRLLLREVQGHRICIMLCPEPAEPLPESQTRRNTVATAVEQGETSGSKGALVCGLNSGLQNFGRCTDFFQRPHWWQQAGSDLWPSPWSGIQRLVTIHDHPNISPAAKGAAAHSQKTRVGTRSRRSPPPKLRNFGAPYYFGKLRRAARSPPTPGARPPATGRCWSGLRPGPGPPC